MSAINFSAAMEKLPLVAILRGVKPDEIIEMADAIRAAGFSMIEVPLNSPDPIQSIEKLVNHMGDEVLVGAGTVLTKEQVDQIDAVGGRLIVSPHTDVELIRYSKEKNLYNVPGFITPTEGFAAIHAGADAIKMFPASLAGPGGLKAMLDVLPRTTPVFPVGGVSADNLGEYLSVGARGFGLGSGLYKAGMSVAEVEANARAYVEAFEQTVASLN